MNDQTQKAPVSPNVSEAKYRTARFNLLGALLFTVVNMVLCITGSGTYFLFSIALPYYLTDLGMALAGKYPPEYYEGSEDFEPLGNGVLIGCLVVALIILAFYLLAFLFSKKPSPAWMTVSLCLFSIDTVVMLLFNLGIIDLIFHIWVIYYLVMGLKTAKQLKNAPEPSPVEAAQPTADDPFAGTYDDQNAPSTEAKPDEDQNNDSFNSGF